jgi:hypothetical protein
MSVEVQTIPVRVSSLIRYNKARRVAFICGHSNMSAGLVPLLGYMHLIILYSGECVYDGMVRCLVTVPENFIIGYGIFTY